MVKKGYYYEDVKAKEERFCMTVCIPLHNTTVATMLHCYRNSEKNFVLSVVESVHHTRQFRNTARLFPWEPN